jgi:hypothetical protein
MACGTRTSFGITLSLLLLLLGAVPGRADMVFDVKVTDTSTFAGQTGAIDIQFDPLGRGGTDMATVLSFNAGGGTLGTITAASTGDFSGDLGHLPLTLRDDTPLNELNQTFTYGRSLDFLIGFKTNPGPGASYYITLYDQDNQPISAGGNGMSALEIDVNRYGSVQDPHGPGVIADVVPEPASMTMLLAGGAGLAGYLGLRRRRRSRARFKPTDG